jgi:hypothetical protein
MIPCELVATKLLPVIRRQVVLEMLKEGKKQREIAQTLNLNESAVSHYIAKRRASAKDGTLDKIVKEQIKQGTIKGKSFAVGVCEICKDLRMSHKLCIIHKRNTKAKQTISPEDCRICLSKCV